MSIRAMAWAWDAVCPSPSAKLVLLKLADHANDEGECWPRQGRIATDCGLTRETVNRQVKLLAEVGLIGLEHRMNGVGQQSNRYVLRCDGKSQGGVTGNHTPCDDRSQGGVTTDHTEPSLEPSIERITPHTPRKRGALAGEFEEFWEAYPHKVGKGAAKQKFETARRQVELAELMAAIERYVSGRRPDQPWCNPATWLHQQRWLDEPASITGALPNGEVVGPTGPPPSVEELLELINRREMGMAR